MSTLEGKRVKQTYKNLLQVSNNNSGVDSTLRPVEDGEGTVSALEISTTDVKVNNLTVTGNVTGLTASDISDFNTQVASISNNAGYITDSDISSNAAVQANTAKVGITTAQASAISVNSAKVGITTSQASAIAANSAKVGITTAQINAISANSAKVGITTAQINAISANSAKVTNATHTGDVTGSTALTLKTVNNSAGSYTNADITIDAKGRVTAASSGAAPSSGPTFTYTSANKTLTITT